jgi:diguanylate cyclase (GGDEF)-like protein
LSVTENSATIEERVRLERVLLFFGHAKGNMAGILVGTLLIGIVLHIGGAHPHALAAWVGLIGISWFSVVRFEKKIEHTVITASNCQRLLRMRITLGAIVALLWGLAGYLLPDIGTQVQDTYIFIILSTLVTVGALGYAAMPSYYITLDIVSLGPLSIKFAYQLIAYGDTYYLLLLVLTVMWQIVVMKKAHQVSRTVIEAIELNERLKDEIEEHKRTKEAIQMMAQHDTLTGLANRALFTDRLNQIRALSVRSGARFAQLYIDLDRFKPVNDAYGHGVGDMLLKAVSSRILSCVRESDTVARIGGDEFVVLLHEVDGDQSALNVAEKIREALSIRFPIDGHEIDIGCSIGVAMYPDHGRDELELSQSADAAMYEAKRAGRNNVRMAGQKGNDDV